MLKFGDENILEVDVAKESANFRTNRGERQADYWVFGGIFRPVWLEASPVEAIRTTAIDARADGNFTADLQFDAARRDSTRLEGQILDAEGKPVGAAFSTRMPNGGSGRLRLATRVESPRLWSAETPNLYSVRLTLFKGEEAIHTTTERFGFRTFEVRPGEGLYLNGQRILLKGVNRHSFRPKTARSLDREDNYADARLIKSMNMNAVRMSHYPPDPDFLEAADEMGLYVLNELSGWHNSHDTYNGRQLVRSMVERDVNHPSILFWDNGNEGGWNRDLDGDFALYDPQKRRVLHPWEIHDDMDTKHYSTWDDLNRRLAGPNLLMPTEVIHALYDGGAGAGIEDYWNAISASKVGAGAFIWVFADEGIMRSDRGGAIDTFSTFAPDGVVGPNHEKEGSYWTLRNIWAHVQIKQPDLTSAAFDGTLQVTNFYDFTSLSQVRLEWQTVRFAGPTASGIAPTVIARGSMSGPDIAAHASGVMKLDLPTNWRSADAVMLTAIGPDKETVWTWTWPTSDPALPIIASGGKPSVVTTPAGVRLAVGSASATFDPETGLLRQVSRGGKTVALANGPRLVFARPRKAQPTWLPLDPGGTAAGMHRVTAPGMADVIEVDLALVREDSYAGFKLEITGDGQRWKTIYDNSRRGADGIRYTFAPQVVSAVRLTTPTGDQGNAVPIRAVRLGFQADRFPAPAGAATVTTGTGPDGAWLEARGGGLETLRWTLRKDGSLKLDYSYNLSGDFIYHGVTFDHPEERIASVRSLGKGPYRVWKNRLRGPELTVREAARSLETPSAKLYPEFQGYFAGLRWARFNTDAGPWMVTSGTSDTYLRIGTPQLGHVNTSPEYPAGDLSFMHAIPAMGSKFVTPENTGPASQPAKASGTYSGSLVFTLPAK